MALIDDDIDNSLDDSFAFFKKIHTNSSSPQVAESIKSEDQGLYQAAGGQHEVVQDRTALYQSFFDLDREFSLLLGYSGSSISLSSYLKSLFL